MLDGGNMSYRFAVELPRFANKYFIITGSEKFFQNIKDEPEDSIAEKFDLALDEKYLYEK